MARLSAELQRFFFEEQRPPQITLMEVLQLSGERTFGFLFVLLSLPSALPIPAPGYSVPFGVIILLLALQLMLGFRRPWLPERLLQRPVDLGRAQGIVKAGVPWLQRLEWLMRPRLALICTSLTGRVVLGMAIALMGLSMMIPLPLTNTAPAIAVLVTGFGLLEDDGAITLAGLTLCLCAFTVSAIIVSAFLIGGVSLLEATVQSLKTALGHLLP